MVFAIISSLSITSQLLLAIAGARSSITSWVTYISALEWKTNQQKSTKIYFASLSSTFFHGNFLTLSEFYSHYNWNWVNHIIFSVEVSKTRIRQNCLLIFLFNPIPMGTGRNQPIYEYHVTTAGRNRVRFLKHDVRCWVRSRICVKYLLSFPQNNLSPEKTETN